MISPLRFNTILFRWYKKHGRHSLPWRKTRDPYHILVSEIMLQQTQVERVLPKYHEFLRRFPTVAALAEAPLGDVLRAWSGLGYNRRAKFLHECAKTLSAGRKAQSIKQKMLWPRTFSELLKLPGVGPSTAAAISSFSFGADEPMIDINIRRIIARVFFKHDGSRASEDRGRRSDVRRPKSEDWAIPSDGALYDFAKTIIPKNRGCEWNWAMMDVGALLCKAKGYSDACPFQKLHGLVGDFIYKKPQKKFAGSDRYYRGRILALLAEATGGVTANALCRKLKIAAKKLSSITSALRRESLIKISSKNLLLP